MTSSHNPNTSRAQETPPSSGGSYASKKCPGLRSCLPNWVSDWKRSHIEKILHIFYEKYSSGLPSEVLEKIPKMKKLSNQQKKYIDVLKESKFGPNIGGKKGNWEYHKTMKMLDKVKLEASSVISDQRLLSENRSLMYVRMRDYIAVLKDFVMKRFQQTKKWIEEGDDNEFKTPRVCEETYSNIVSAFATLCGLRVIKGDEDSQSEWKNLRGNEKVISKPDFRFHSTGPDFSADNSNLLTVIAVKSRDHYTDEQKLKRKLDEQSEKRAKRRRTSLTYSSSSTSTSESQTFTRPAWTSTVNLQIYQTEGNIKPWIESDVGEHTLGQHAGELLLDLHEYVKKSQSDLQPTTILAMPGMIVDQTTVYLTLLEISLQHFQKLTGTEQLLTSDDKATIYYSIPHNILDEEDLGILFNAFVSLNNIESLIK